MSPVFGAVILWLATVILWWSGWKEETSGGIPQRAVAIFLSGWPLFMGWSLPLTSSLSLQGAWLWMFALILAIAWKLEGSQRWTSASAGLLFGAIFILLHRLTEYPLGWSKVAAPWGIAILVGGMASVLLKDAPSQLLSLSVAVALGEGVPALFFAASGAGDEASLAWMRNWWIAVLFARLCATIAEAFVRFKQARDRKIGWRRGDERS